MHLSILAEENSMDALQQITAKDIAGWDSLFDVASTFEKRGLKVRDNLGDSNELILQLTDREFIQFIGLNVRFPATNRSLKHLAHTRWCRAARS